MQHRGREEGQQRRPVVTASARRGTCPAWAPWANQPAASRRDRAPRRACAAGEVGVHRATVSSTATTVVMTRPGHRRRRRGARPAVPGSPDLRPEHEDAGRDHPEVEHADDDDRDDRRPRDVASRVAVVRGQRGDRLPAGEPPDDDRGGRRDGPPAVRGEGVRWLRSACGRAATVATVSSRASRMAIPSWTRPEIRTPNQLSTATAAMITPAAPSSSSASRRPGRPRSPRRRPRPAGRPRRRRRRTASPRRWPRGRRRPSAHTSRSRRRRGPRAEGREPQRERRGQDDERQPGQDRRRSGDPRRHGGQRDHTRPEDGADGEGRALRDGHP